MKPMDDLIQAATYRLGPDAELQREIARELRAHLEDAVAAARADGMDDAHAEESAVRAFGDPEEVGEKLWQANRRRMRLHAMAKWTARLVLMPAGILLAVWLCAATVDFGDAFLAFSYPSMSAPNDNFLHGLLARAHDHRLENLLSGGKTPALLRDKLVNGFYDWVVDRSDKGEEQFNRKAPARNGLNEDEQLLLEALRSKSGEKQSAEKWEQLIGRHPDNPVYRARQYALFYNREAAMREPLLPSKPKVFDRALALLDAGEKTDPDNAFWNYMKADLLMHRSGAAKQEMDPSFTYTYHLPGLDKPVTANGMRLVLKDRAMFERGLEEYRKGLTKPFYKSYAAESNDELLALLKQPTNVMEEVSLVLTLGDTVEPDLGATRKMSSGIVAYAALLVKEGHPQEAEALIRTAAVPGAQIGGSSRTTIEIMLAASMRQSAFRQGVALYERLGKHDLAEQALALSRKESFNVVGKFFPLAEPHVDLLIAILDPAEQLADPSILTDLRQAERFWAERAALSLLALPLLIVVGWLGLRTLWCLWRHRRDTSGPKLYFIGWRRLGWIALIAIVLPLAAYVIFTRAFAFGSAHYGINHQPARLALEMGGTALLVFGLSLFLGRRAARKRCRDAGITDRAEFRMSVRRSLLPVMVACFLIVGIVSQAYLRYGEYSAVKALSQPGRRLGLDVMDYIARKDYKDYLRALPDHGALPTAKEVSPAQPSEGTR